MSFTTWALLLITRLLPAPESPTNRSPLLLQVEPAPVTKTILLLLLGAGPPPPTLPSPPTTNPALLIVKLFQAPESPTRRLTAPRFQTEPGPLTTTLLLL